jgi:SAM-dependent methyltransferase
MITYEELLSKTDLKGAMAISEKHQKTCANFLSKYLNVEEWLFDGLKRVAETVNDEKRPLKILDIGTGAGYVPFICSLLGHEVIALDNSVEPFFIEMANFLGIDRRIYNISPIETLPFGRFDYVMGHNVTFDYRWIAEDYEAFLTSLVKNNFAEGGRAFFSFNYNWDKEEVARVLLSFGYPKEKNRFYINGPK